MVNNSLFQNLVEITDPRQQGKVKHNLLDILFLMLSAIILGSLSWEDIEDFGQDKLT